MIFKVTSDYYLQQLPDELEPVRGEYEIPSLFVARFNKWREESKNLPRYEIPKDFHHLVTVGQEMELGKDFKLEERVQSRLGIRYTVAVPVTQKEENKTTNMNEDIKRAQMLAGEQAVRNRLIEKGLLSKVVTISNLLELLALHGGTIESTGSMDEMNIKQARASDRMYVDENGLGFVWMPPGLFPESVEQVKLFEQWFPLEVELPERLNNLDWLNNKKEEPKQEEGKERCPYEMCIIKYFGLPEDVSFNKSPKVIYADLVDLLCCFDQTNKKDELYTVCGGCGAVHPKQRCIGCAHDFKLIH
jgi:hypothetical protein